MTYVEAEYALRAAGLVVERRAFGLRGEAPAAVSGDSLRFELGRASAGGDELSVRRASGGTVRWFHRPTLEALVALVLVAQRQVEAGGAPSLLDALLALDGR